MHKLVFFVPEEQKESVKQAVFAAGAGAFGNYDRCSWETAGVGQFRPLDGANPTIGRHGITERVAEFRVEMVVQDALLEPVLAAFIAAHPYEEPAYELIAIKTRKDVNGESHE